MGNGNKQTRPEEGVHQEPNEAVRRPTELWAESEDAAADGHGREQGKVRVPDGVFVVETKVGARDAGPPYHEHDTQVVELVAEFVHVRAVVGKGVVDCREEEADDDAGEVYGDGKAICEVDTVGESRPDEEVGG